MSKFTSRVLFPSCHALALAALSSTALADSSAALRKCVALGMSARCGDAMELVHCEGFEEAHFIANDQKLASLAIDLYVGPPSINRKRAENLARIEAPRASIREFSLALAGGGQDLLSGKARSSSGDSAMSELIDAFKKRNSRIKVNPSVDNPVLGRFTIPMGAPLYRSCSTSEGVVAPGSDAPKESDAERRIREYKERAERIDAELRAKYGLGPEAKFAGFLTAMDHRLTRFTGSTKVKLTGNALEMSDPDGGGVFFYGDLIPIILKHWNLTREQARDGIAVDIVQGKRKLN